MTSVERSPRMRPAVGIIKPYVPGRSVESVQRELGIDNLVKLNQNENPLGPSPRAVAAAMAAMADVHMYPEGSSPSLRERLAVRWDLPDDWFLAGNGSDEVFRLLAEVYLDPGDRVVVGEPSFAGYPLVAELMGADVVRVPLVDGAMDVPAMAREARVREAKLVFLCRPNNPTGAVFGEDALHHAMSRIPDDTLVVVDEAYRDFDATQFDARGLLLRYPNLIVTRTFSKIYGMAGFRLGYGVMRPALIEPLYRARDPFSVNSIAVAAGIAALADRDHVERTLDLVHTGKSFLSRVLERLELPSVPSQANFILFETPWPAVEIYEALLRRGVLVRPCTSFGLPHSLRVTIGTAEENSAFARELEAVARDRHVTPSV